MMAPQNSIARLFANLFCTTGDIIDQARDIQRRLYDGLSHLEDGLPEGDPTRPWIPPAFHT
jgi:hypothetical protein